MDKKEFEKELKELDSKYFIENISKFGYTHDQKVLLVMRFKESLNEVMDILTKETGDFVAVCESCSLPIYEKQPHIYDNESVCFHQNGECDRRDILDEKPSSEVGAY